MSVNACVTEFLLKIHHTFLSKGKGKVFYGQEPPSGESTTTECGVNYQLLAVMLLKSSPIESSRLLSTTARVGPPTTSRVTPGGVTRIKLGNSG